MEVHGLEQLHVRLTLKGARWLLARVHCGVGPRRMEDVSTHGAVWKALDAMRMCSGVGNAVEGALGWVVLHGVVVASTSWLHQQNTWEWQQGSGNGEKV
ncbi:hypothetical protein AXF42_Ash021691 [Apostasia shenzhenica]|uniref:Uncharacterized protein n=1 Tax=Apostasia shenzhenica TaxID=1088818 RepID=A0A2H9ZT10_9ASPA|nr:hypothetical protein AXF42_Ash021691 [Apostasia shenzhenica]